ncbi:hypothetical protein [Leptospira stimsonii]|uniref:Uncharacterized protein n=1 Tax=Leptospira stimsonii TaxID=2202203 RepID=A0A396Z2H4_9LEPT|nr:hypothetical protein [Leptospira stimsonii]RHX89671.1 hypothetical protein DLM75_11930 [Leptospira stimsonii]
MKENSERILKSGSLKPFGTHEPQSNSNAPLNRLRWMESEFVDTTEKTFRLRRNFLRFPILGREGPVFLDGWVKS